MQPQTSNAKKPSGYITLTREMLLSEAYYNLTPSSAKALPLFIMKIHYPHSDPMRYYGTEFKFPYSEAKKRHGFAERTFRKAIQQLEKYGFIKQVIKGGIKGGQKIESTYKLSDKWKNLEAKDASSAERPEVGGIENTTGDYQPQSKASNF